MTSKPDDQPHVIGLVGASANNILTRATETYAAAFANKGLSFSLIDVNAPDSMRTLVDIIESRRIFLVIAFQGIGRHLSADGVKSLWEAYGIPYLAQFGDGPCYNSGVHKCGWQGAVNIYASRDHFIASRDHVCSQQATFLQPAYGLPANPHARTIPWNRRTVRYLLVKTGPGTFELDFVNESVGPSLKPAVLACCEQGLRNQSLPLTVLVDRVLDDYGIMLNDPAEYWWICYQVDRYVREWRTNRLVQSLLGKCELTIIGDGWGHLDLGAGKTTLLPAVDGNRLDQLYADTRFVINVNPNFIHGVHERVPAAMMANAAVISDSNATYDAVHARHPTFFGYDWQGEDIAASVLDRTETVDCTPMVDEARLAMEEYHCIDSHCQRLIDHALWIWGTKIMRKLDG